jgi:hypothetical protein
VGGERTASQVSRPGAAAKQDCDGGQSEPIAGTATRRNIACGRGDDGLEGHGASVSLPALAPAGMAVVCCQNLRLAFLRAYWAI